VVNRVGKDTTTAVVNLLFSVCFVDFTPTPTIATPNVHASVNYRAKLCVLFYLYLFFLIIDFIANKIYTVQYTGVKV